MKKIFITALLIGTFTLSYAQSDYYNDYRRSISDINWQTVIGDLILSKTQASQIFALNDRYDDYNSWNKTYGHNPDRWREDRYAQLENILGREKYQKFKTKYYKGQNPVAVYNRNKNNDTGDQQWNKKGNKHHSKQKNKHH
ncbi:hypothetical protein ODZ84_04490 [Chryseobacterium fluminis]|uniref:hypothetical protein n=1 Tax=Chryseobacterium fluminis TaxID=2983606 RepID=UPI002258D846|nr:hypothetical protein [Chryseobacterium sp. MMS21-Ot14]UZT98836.1 hypothetical protein ODZ84_04490 [Chryseobacterium sp. MMS21-Ot14]